MNSFSPFLAAVVAVLFKGIVCVCVGGGGGGWVWVCAVWLQ